MCAWTTLLLRALSLDMGTARLPLRAVGARRDTERKYRWLGRSSSATRATSRQGVRVDSCVTRPSPNRQARARRGKSDPVDAVEAARAAQSRRASGIAKSRDGAAEAIRALVVLEAFGSQPAHRRARPDATHGLYRPRRDPGSALGAHQGAARQPGCGPATQRRRRRGRLRHRDTDDSSLVICAGAPSNALTGTRACFVSPSSSPLATPVSRLARRYVQPELALR